MATYYIATAANGGDNANNGSVGSPWLTLTYACSQVTTAGDTIYVNNGTYTESARSNLSSGVNILGQSEANAIINFTYVSTDYDSGCIRLYSAALNNSANQSISYLTITGSDFTAYTAITIYYRGNVDIHHCTIKNFMANGIVYSGPNEIRTTNAEDNTLYNCTITDCSKRISGQGYGSVGIKGQKRLLIHDNEFDNSGRDAGDNGNIINGVQGGYEALKFYNNVLTKPNFDDDEWNMHMEMWSSNGGCEYYDNVFNGGEYAINIGSAVSETAGHFKNGYDYTHYIHDNLFDNLQKQATPDTPNNDRICICIEDCQVNDVWITRNWFEQMPTCISIEVGTADDDFGPYNNIHIYYNVFNDIGYTDNDVYGTALWIKAYGTAAEYNNFTFQNNTVIGGPVGKPYSIVRFVFSGTLNGLDISNNIMLNAYTAWLYTSYGSGGSGDVYDLVVRNNILYGNANNNGILDASGMIDGDTYISEGNINEDPDFVSTSDFHLTATSPAINAGYNLTLEYDYDGVAVHATTPEIGAYEYIDESSGITSVPDTTTFTLQDVCDVVQPSSDTLLSCFNEADSGAFDPSYEGDRDSLLDFRNYNG
jgi:hypothetical protein